MTSSAVDAALIQRLVSDPQLVALMPDGVYFNVAPLDAARFVSVELVSHADTYGFDFVAWEVFRYRVKAVALNSNGTDVTTAADRIHALLQDAIDLAIPGYAVMRAKRFDYVRTLTVDPDNTGIRYQHRGGDYDIQVTPLTDRIRAGGALLGQGG